MKYDDREEALDHIETLLNCAFRNPRGQCQWESCTDEDPCEQCDATRFLDKWRPGWRKA